MTADAYGRQDDPPASDVAKVPAPREEAAFVGPVTLGRPHWRRRHLRATATMQVAAVGCAPGLYLLWQTVVRAPLIATALSVVALSVGGRSALRGWLLHLRRQGRGMSTALAVGTVDRVAALVERTRRAPDLGWRIGAACTPTGAGPDGASSVAGIPVVGDLDSIAAEALAGHFDAVMVGPAPGWTGIRLQQLAANLDQSHTALLVDPRLVRRTGPRLTARGVDGLPLLRLVHPELGLVAKTVKGAADRVGALLTLILLAPVLLACTVAVRCDGGPVFRRRTRVGRGTRRFALLTFRTTDVDSGAPTPVGQVLRRYCLDELPQLLNVVGGSMALVGPRPCAPGEYAAGRPLLVKPGLTGLWQLGTSVGDETTARDLRYVAHWTPVLDLKIILRTLRAVLADRTRR